MYVDKFYSDDALRRVLANGVAARATAEWPWIPISSPGERLVRRRGLRTKWGGILLYTFDELDLSEIGVEGYLCENPFFHFGEIWGNGAAVGTHLSDLVSMHFARLTRSNLSTAGWVLEDHDPPDGVIFRASAALSSLDAVGGERLGMALGKSLVRANVEHLMVACQARAYLEGLKDFTELPVRPISDRAASS